MYKRQVTETTFSLLQSSKAYTGYSGSQRELSVFCSTQSIHTLTVADNFQSFATLTVCSQSQRQLSVFCSSQSIHTMTATENFESNMVLKAYILSLSQTLCLSQHTKHTYSQTSASQRDNFQACFHRHKNNCLL